MAAVHHVDLQLLPAEAHKGGGQFAQVRHPFSGVHRAGAELDVAGAAGRVILRRVQSCHRTQQGSGTVAVRALAGATPSTSGEL